MQRSDLKIIITEDGSHSLYREDLKETYHSFHGALGESRHVFITMGLQYLLEKERREIHIFEVGFGTGLNALLALQFAEEYKIRIKFHTVEPFPIPEEVYSHLNYGSKDGDKKIFQELHAAEWESPVKISDLFTLYKYKKKLEDFDVSQINGSCDAIFFDAFAPSKQSELWELENIQLCYDLLSTGGILTTYCAQGQFKRNMAAAGFEVQTLQGAPGKKEMVRGVKN